MPRNKVSVEKSAEDVLMPNLSKLYITDSHNGSCQKSKKEPVALHLELKKAYDFSPPASDLTNRR